MIKSFLMWWHHISDPHCPECIHSVECKSCETLKLQLEIANESNKRLLDTILEFTKPRMEEVSKTPVELESIKPKAIPWRIRKEMLESEDREQFRILKERQKSLEELEKEVGLDKEQEKVNG